MKVWDASSAQEVFAIKGQTGYVESVAFSPHGQRLVSGSKDTAFVHSVTFSPDGE